MKLTYIEEEILIDLINRWEPNCQGRCNRCEFSVQKFPFNQKMCPLNYVKNMIYMKNKFPKDWQEICG